jgi:hypothetical protein
MVCENIFTVSPRPNGWNGACSHKIDYITIFLGDFKSQARGMY